MVQTTKLRRFRLKYNIPLIAISERAGISNQQVSRLELGTIRCTEENKARLVQAVETLIAESRELLDQMEQDFHHHREHLMDLLEVETEESEDEL